MPGRFTFTMKQLLCDGMKSTFLDVSQLKVSSRISPITFRRSGTSVFEFTLAVAAAIAVIGIAPALN